MKDTIKLFLSTIDKIVINEKDIASQITEAIIQMGKIKFDNGTAYANVGTHWQKISRQDLLTIIRNMVESSDRTRVKSTHIVEIAKRISEDLTLNIDVEKAREKQQYLVNFQNCLVDVRTGEIITDRSKYILDSVLEAEYKENCSEADCPTFMNFIETSMGLENKNCIFNVTGFMISPVTGAKKAVFLTGETDGGKSTYLLFLESCVAPELVSHVSFQQLSDKYFTLQLEGMTMNVGYDNSGQAVGNEHVFKSIVSNERIEGRALRDNPKQFTPRAKLIFASNKAYVFKHPDSALYRRMVIVPFEHSIPADKQDPELLEKLIAERDIICSISVKKLKQLVESGYDFQMSAKGQAYLTSRIADLNSVKSFLTERAVTEDDATISMATLFESYKEWCKDNSLTAEGRNEFRESVLSFTPGIDYRKVGPRQKRVWGFKGLRLKNAAELDVPVDNTEERN